MATNTDLISEAEASLRRVQDFSTQDLVQQRRLGELSFEDAVEPASKLISLFKQIPSDGLRYFADTELETVKTQSNSVYALFDEIKSFDLNEPDPRSRRTAQLERLKSQYQRVFTNIYPLVSYSMARTVDFHQLSDQGRAAVQEIRDHTSILLGELEVQKNEAQNILEDVRRAAAEQGVSQQASYFKEEADQHAKAADFWRVWTIRMACVVLGYGVLALVLHKWTWLAPTNVAEAVQFSVSKLLVFFVLAYMLFLCSRNFMSNRHNEIVNRHRQNSLMTYKALVDAGGTPEARDAILNHAAASIYRLHDTGYTKGSDSGGPSSTSIVEMLPKLTLPASTSS